MIKLIAIITMLIDHIGAVFYPQNLIFRVIGRLSFPMFAFSLAKGYRRTSNLKNYLLRLLFLGVISQYPYTKLFGNAYLNVCFTLSAGLLLLVFINERNPVVRILGTVGIMLVSHFLNLEYGIYGLLTILAFYIFENDRRLLGIQALLTAVGMAIYGLHLIQLFSIFATYLIINLKSLDFKLNKIMAYGFYPVHIMVLLIIKLMVT